MNFLVATFNRKSSKSFESCLACWTALVYFRVYSRAYFSCECVSSSAQHLLMAHTVGRTLHLCKITPFVSLFNAVAPVGPELHSPPASASRVGITGVSRPRGSFSVL